MNKIVQTKGSPQTRSPYIKTLQNLALGVLLFAGIQAPLQAQAQDAKYTRPSWWFGAAGGANFNFYDGSTQQLTPTLTSQVAFHSGFGVGLFAAPLIEYYRPGSVLGLMLQGGYDSRKGEYDTQLSPCNCPRDLDVKLSYITIEPSLRIAPFRNNFYLFVGPRFAINQSKSFTFRQGTNPDYPEQVAPADIEGDLSEVNPYLISGQVGAAYDFHLSTGKRATQFVLAPFVSFQPYFGQDPRSIETWSVTTLRAGVALKLGRGRLIPTDEETRVKPADVVVEENKTVEPSLPEVMFTVNAPANIPAARKVREIFPLRNYVFFDLESTEIPARYVTLQKSQVAEFKEDQVELFTPKNLSGRSDRQMVVYYNILNILGDRMGKNPMTNITLVGSSAQGSVDGRVMAESIKTYLVNVFGINPSRIITEGRDKPKLPSVKSGGTQDLTLLKEGDRRVSIESSSPVLLMEFQSGPSAPLKPVEVVAVVEAPLESYVTVNTQHSDEVYKSWNLEVKDEAGNVKTFGPYHREDVSIPGKSILGERPEGNYVFTMIGETKTGNTEKKFAHAKMVLWTAPVDQEVMRFSVIYEFDESDVSNIYVKYLNEIVLPKIPQGGKVIIHGYTDVIGDEAYNHTLSHKRAKDVQDILKSGLSKQGRTDVTFEVSGSGEDKALSPFENKYPEERFYNRTVLIDIVPRN